MPKARGTQSRVKNLSTETSNLLTAMSECWDFLTFEEEGSKQCNNRNYNQYAIQMCEPLQRSGPFCLQGSSGFPLFSQLFLNMRYSCHVPRQSYWTTAGKKN
ncbi:hypothetical protein Y1Q_0022879 [Alligator mississippiensis]|uniref:Uncharacterized protein n=1 Tax=Alligator mississippiensis TaxID=8496 RepID=A0A151N4R3_ALLMI|nr:hypothetical protein Y1Q_0022879 [Alligator mississippiensis]